MRRAVVTGLCVLGLVVGPAPGTPAGAHDGVLLHGAITGEDGRAVNALLGFDFMDSAGRRLRRDGCPISPQCPLVGYASVVRVNPRLTALGSTNVSEHEMSYAVEPPTATARVFVEVYPQNDRRRTDETRYGHAMRHSVEVPLSDTLDFRLPLTDCGDGGSVGNIVGTASRDGAALPLARVVAWSSDLHSSQDRPILGWNVGTVSAGATFVVPNLPPLQRYAVWLTAKDGSTARLTDVEVSPCTDTSVQAVFPPRDEASAGDPPMPPVVQPGMPVPYGRRVEVTGSAAPGVQVHLWGEDPGQQWRLVRSTISDPDGSYRFTVQPTSTARLRVRVGGADSPPVTLTVRSGVTLGPTRLTGRTYRFAGQVQPVTVGTTVELRHQSAAGDRVLLTTTTGPDGRFLLSRRFAGRGRVVLQARVAGTGHNAAGRSAPVVLQVR